MMKKYLACCLITLLSAANAEASQCIYQDEDITDSLSKIDDVISIASEKQVPHPTTEVPLKHIVMFQGGDVAIIEQRNCVIFNLSINVLASEDTSEESIMKRLSNLLQVTPVIKNYFKNTNFTHDIAESIKKSRSTLSQNSNFKINLTDDIPADSIDTEMSLVYIINDSIYSLYNRSITFYIGAGMHD